MQELLSQEFPGDENLPAAENLVSEATPVAAHPETEQTTPADLFSQPEENYEQIKEANEVRNKHRGKLIKDIFGTVKGKIMYWFEDVDDRPLD
ncbi:MAG: hypothetical protein HWD58_13805 [Bacteroidota bacterium]|nr:MAG: hypothetical protein HWD58_13805 [Bacteroidota bacterium]